MTVIDGDHRTRKGLAARQRGIARDLTRAEVADNHLLAVQRGLRRTQAPGHDDINRRGGISLLKHGVAGREALAEGRPLDVAKQIDRCATEQFRAPEHLHVGLIFHP